MSISQEFRNSIERIMIEPGEEEDKEKVSEKSVKSASDTKSVKSQMSNDFESEKQSDNEEDNQKAQLHIGSRIKDTLSNSSYKPFRSNDNLNPPEQT